MRAQASGRRRAGRARAPSGADAGLWLGFALASSPTIVDLARHVWAEPWAAYCVVFWVLLAGEILRRRERGQARMIGTAVVAAGFLLQYAMHAAGWPRAARPAIPLACVGLAMARGHPPLRSAGLALWLVPVPQLLVRLGSPELEAGLLSAAAGIWILVGAPIRIEGSLAIGPGGSLAVLAPDGGLPLAALLAGLAWYESLRRADPAAATTRRICGLVSLALPIQILALALAVGGVAAGASEEARRLLTHAPWVLCATLIFWRAARARNPVSSRAE